MFDSWYSVNGVSLEDPLGRWFTLDKTEDDTGPSPVDVAPDRVNQHGVSFVRGGLYRGSKFTLEVMVTDATDRGVPGGRGQLQSNVAFVKGLFADRSKPVRLEREFYGVKTFRDVRHVGAMNDVEVDPVTRIVRFVLEPTQPFHRSTETVEQPLGSLGGASPVLTCLAGGNAPVLDGVFEFAGALSKVTIEDHGSGKSIVVSGVNASAGSVLTVDVGSWRAALSGVDVSGLVDVGPGGFELSPYVNTTSGVARVLYGVRVVVEGGTVVGKFRNGRKAWM